MGPSLDADDMFEDIVSGGKKPYRARAGDPGLSVPHLFPFFDAVIYTRMDDSPQGFFATYRGLFARLAAEEAAWSSANGDTIDYPPFGDSNTPWAPAVKPKGKDPKGKDKQVEYVQHFYRAWSNFVTAKDFSWRDIWDTDAAPDRRIRRLMEKDNKKAREESRREYNDAVRALVSFIRKRDPRLQAFKTAQAKQASTTTSKGTASGQAPSTFVEQEWQRARSTAGDHADLDWGLAEGDDEEYECVVCNKSFQSEAAWSSHERSKKHMKEVERLKKQMKAENVELGLDTETQGDGVKSEELPTPADGNASDEDPDHQAPPTKMSKKQKKMMRKARSMAAKQAESETQSPMEQKDVPLAEDLAEQTQGLSVETANTQEDGDKELDDGDQESDGPAATPSKREKRRAREAAKKAREAETPVQICNVCAEPFESRSKLFAHIEASGHQLAAPQRDEGPRNGRSGAKKGKSNGKR
ncbi:hypothetical protein FRC06_010764 [Ceratobasidium sp. 370]|nr:hypothetical protein FRC06_010764 [Ceratobasidium sp. 370]